jgi:phosphatidylglycerol:prolipoprotein diacylglycerol transferase
MPLRAREVALVLAEIPYPQIDPVIVRIGGFALRWYGVSYILAFALAYVVLRWLSKRGRWPVPPERVGDVLFWGILGVFVGGRLGYMAFYAEDKSPEHWVRVWEGGMAFHGGLLGVIVAYWIYAKVAKVRFRDLADGLALATPLGIFCVRLANFVNAELIGRPWDGPWAMRFPKYDLVTMEEVGRTPPVHPSQLYQALTEGLLLFFLLRWLMIGRGWGGGRVAAAFTIGYGAFRFVTEFFREPDPQVGYFWGWATEGQLFCVGMVVLGTVALALLSRAPAGPLAPPAPRPAPPPPA